MSFDFTNMTIEEVADIMYPRQRDVFLECLYGEGDVLCTAPGGFGKSFIIDAVKHFAGDRTVTTATTGSAAVLVNGTTVHSTLALPLGIPTKQDMSKTSKRYKSLFKRNHPIQNIIVDEFPMTGPHTFDAQLQRIARISKTSRYKRCRLLVFGDYAQMLNVIKGQEKDLVRELYGTTTLLDSKIFKEHDFKLFSLDQNKRTTDKEFQQILEWMRLGENKKQVVDYLNKRVGKPDPESIYLCTTNAQVDKINQQAFRDNPNSPMYYYAEISGTFKESDTMLSKTLALKEGLRVMCLINAPTEGDEEPDYVNGSVGVVTSLVEGAVEVLLDNGKTVIIEPTEQKNIEYYTDSEGELKQRTIGTFKNIGLKVCYSVSVNKSQGMTLDKANVDFGDNGAFTYGQAYTAISRLRSIEGLTLVRPITESDIKVNRHVKKFYNKINGVVDTTFPLIVAGGRDFNDYPLLCKKLDSLLRSKNPEDVVIVCGKAAGADSLGECYARERGYRVWEFPAEWDRFGKRAGYLRNSLMADHADALVAFHDGVSRGTQHMIELAKEQGLAIRVVNF